MLLIEYLWHSVSSPDQTEAHPQHLLYKRYTFLERVLPNHLSHSNQMCLSSIKKSYFLWNYYIFNTDLGFCCQNALKYK